MLVDHQPITVAQNAQTAWMSWTVECLAPPLDGAMPVAFAKLYRYLRVYVSAEIGSHRRLRSQNTPFRNGTKRSDCMCRMSELRVLIARGFWNALRGWLSLPCVGDYFRIARPTGIDSLRS